MESHADLQQVYEPLHQPIQVGSCPGMTSLREGPVRDLKIKVLALLLLDSLVYVTKISSVIEDLGISYISTILMVT